MLIQTDVKTAHLRERMAYRRRVYLARQIAGATLLTICAAGTLTVIALMLLVFGN